MRQSVYITVCILMTLCVTACADKERQSTPVQENITATTAAQGTTENDSELAGKSDGRPSEKPSDESSDEYFS